MITIREGRLMWETNSNIENVWMTGSLGANQTHEIMVHVRLKTGERIDTKYYPVEKMDDAVDEADKLVKENNLCQQK